MRVTSEITTLGGSVCRKGRILRVHRRFVGLVVLRGIRFPVLHVRYSGLEGYSGLEVDTSPTHP